MDHDRRLALAALLGAFLLLILLAFARPLDHDESQYVAAAELSRRAVVYRDFAYFQTPLQALLLGHLVALFGAWALPGTRLVNALLGAVSLTLICAACRAAGADRRSALIATGLFACCDIFLFSAAVARNDMLPACLFSGTLFLMVRQTRGTGNRVTAMTIGFLLSAATAAKLSYAMPALAYGGLALIDRRHRPVWLILGAVPATVLVATTWAIAPDAFVFDVLRFPTAAPEQFYAAGRAWKLGLWTRLFDVVKFLALGPALLALGLVIRDRRRDALAVMLDVMIVAGLIAAILPAPTWRQYMLLMLPPLFVRAAQIVPVLWSSIRGRVAAAIFIAAGLAPSLVTLVAAMLSGWPLLTAIKDGRALRAEMDRLHIDGPIATLSPQFVPATGRPIDPRFATGPFFFRSTGLLSSADERRFALVSRATVAAQFALRPPAAIITGGEGAWTSGDPELDVTLSAVAQAQDWQAVTVPGTPFTLYINREGGTKIGEI